MSYSFAFGDREALRAGGGARGGAARGGSVIAKRVGPVVVARVANGVDCDDLERRFARR